MILLDTNVLSEAMRLQPSTRVMRWLDSQRSDNLLVSSISVAEILFGIARMPDGKRKQALHDAALALFTEDFTGRVLAFDGEAACHYAEQVAERERKGQPIAMADAQIAAICRSHAITLATRNTKDFVGLGIELIDPWLTE